MHAELPRGARLLLGGIVAACLPIVGCGSGSSTDPKPGASRSSPPTATAAATTAAPTTATARAAVTSVRRQRFEGFGTAIASETVLDPWAQTEGLTAQQVRRMDAITLGAGIRLVRIFGPGQNPGAGQTVLWTAEDARLRFMQRLRGRGVRFIFTGQGAPAALVQGGGVTGPLLAGSERAYGHFLAACLEVAARAGAPFAFAAVGNEVDNQGDPGVTLTPEQTATATRVLERQIRKRRLPTRVVLGDNTTWTKSLEYAKAQLGALRRRRPAFVATHAYGGDEQRPDLARFARRRGLPLWMTEWVSACPAGDCPDDPSIGFALRWAEQITTDLTIGQASAWFMFRGVSDATHGPDGAIVVRDQARPQDPLSTTKRYPIVRQFAVAAPPGSRRLEARVTAAPGVRALAFTRRGGQALVLTHTGSEAVTIQAVLGTRPGAIRGWRTSESEDFRRFVDRRIESGHLTLGLPARSVTTLVFR